MTSIYEDLYELNIKSINQKINNDNTKKINIWNILININNINNIKYKSNSNNLETIIDHINSIPTYENTNFLNFLYTTEINNEQFEFVYHNLKYKPKYFEFLYNLLFFYTNKVVKFEKPHYTYNLTNIHSFIDYEPHKTKDININSICYLFVLIYKSFDHTFLEYFLKKNTHLFKKYNILSKKLFEYFFMYITDYTYSEPLYYDITFRNHLMAKYYINYFKFIQTLTYYIESVFDNDSVTKILNFINLNTIVGKEYATNYFIYISKYFKEDIYYNIDEYGYSLILDCAKYGNFNLFKILYMKTHNEAMFENYDTNSNNILNLSIYNKDTRIFDFILN